MTDIPCQHCGHLWPEHENGPCTGKRRKVLTDCGCEEFFLLPDEEQAERPTAIPHDVVSPQQQQAIVLTEQISSAEQVKVLINDNTYDGTGLSKELVIAYDKMNFQPISLEADGTRSDSDLVYSLERALSSNFKNIGTLLGSRMTDSGMLFLNYFCSNSKDVITKLQIDNQWTCGEKTVEQGFMERMYKETFIISSKKEKGFFWFSFVKSPPILSKMCKGGQEFEIRTEDSQFAILPPSLGYQSTGADIIRRSPDKNGKDMIYSWLVENLKDCLKDDVTAKAKMDGAEIPDNLREKGVSEIIFRQPYSQATVNGTEVFFKVFSSWNDTKQSIYRGFKDTGVELDMIVFLANYWRKHHPPDIRDVKTTSKPKFDVNLVEIVSEIITSANDWLKSHDIWDKFVEKVGPSSAQNKHKFSCRFGVLYRNSTLPGILKQLGAEHKRTKTGGAWLLQQKDAASLPTANYLPIPQGAITAITAPVPPVPLTDLREVLNLEQRRTRIRKLTQEGHSRRRVGVLLGISHTAVIRALKYAENL